MRPTPSFPIGALALAAALASTATADPVTTVLMKGLDNPRGLTFAPNGALFVAESGHGGAPCPPAGGGLTCYGLTGAVSRFWQGEQVRVVTGLPSIAFALGANARGPNEIAMHGAGHALVTIGLEDVAASRDALHRDGLGFLVDIPGSALMAPPSHLRTDNWTFDQDVAAYWAAAPQPKESDPFSILAVPGGYVMTDASANALMKVEANGDLSTIAFFPSRPERTPFVTDSVPTTVAVGPDGAYYVGEFTGFAPPPPNGNANVYRVVPGEAPRVYCAGFNRIIDIAFEADGSLLVLQYATTAANTGAGVIWEAAPPDPEAPEPFCGARQRVETGIALDQPTSIAIGPDGALYVTNRGGRAGQVGEVLRIER